VSRSKRGREAEVEEAAEVDTVESTVEDTNSESITLMKKDSPSLRMKKHTTHTIHQGDNREVLEEPSTVEEEASTEEENTAVENTLLENINMLNTTLLARLLRVRPVEARTLEVTVSETSQEKSPVERDVEANSEGRDVVESSVVNVVEANSAVNAVEVNSEAKDAVVNSVENVVEEIDLGPSTNPVNIEDVAKSEHLMSTQQPGETHQLQLHQ